MRKRIGVVAFIVGVLAAAAAMIARWAARTNDVPSIDEIARESSVEPGVDADRFLEHLGEAIAIRTVSTDAPSSRDASALLDFHRFIERTYPAVHQRCVREVVNEFSLLYTWRGTDQSLDPIVLMAHIDVVPIEPGTEGDWTEDPFSGAVAGDHLWGRGALDDKGSLIAILEAVEHLMGAGVEPKRTVHLAFGHDEEVGGTEGASHIAEVLRTRGVTPWFVLDEGGLVLDDIPAIVERPVAVVRVAEKGYIDLKLVARGQGGHSSTPPKSTAAGRIAKAVRLLEENPMSPRISAVEPLLAALAPHADAKVQMMISNLAVTGRLVARQLGRVPATNASIRTTTAVTMISGGVKSNVLPQEAWAVVNFRIIPGDSVADVITHVESLVGPDVAVEVHGPMRSEPSGFSSTDSAAWTIVSSTIASVFPEAIVAPWVLVGATDSKYFADFSGDVYGFIPVGTESDVAGFHGTNERIRTSDAGRAVSFYCRLIRAAQVD